jgi:hypothetical protein
MKLNHTTLPEDNRHYIRKPVVKRWDGRPLHASNIGAGTAVLPYEEKL